MGILQLIFFFIEFVYNVISIEIRQTFIWSHKYNMYLDFNNIS